MVIIAGIVAVLVAIAGISNESSRGWMISGLVCEAIGFGFPPMFVVGGILQLIGIFKLLF